MQTPHTDSLGIQISTLCANGVLLGRGMGVIPEHVLTHSRRVYARLELGGAEKLESEVGLVFVPFRGYGSGVRSPLVRIFATKSSQKATITRGTDALFL